MKLTFLGATKTVTGSKYLIETDRHRILIDCGLFQGYKELRLRNWAASPLDPHTIDAVVLTHAHIDHSGYLPLLVKNGFKGPIYATSGTTDLCGILLPDSGHLQEEEAYRANKYHYSKHEPALPLYTVEDALTALKQFKPVEINQYYQIVNDISVKWHRAGHIIGSSIIELSIEGKSLIFTGDLGRLHDPIMKPPAIIERADYLVIESTYGNRLHDKVDPKDMLARVINETAKRGGTVLIPAFAVGRAQNMLFYLNQLKQDNRIPDLPIYLDSPMAINASEIFCKHTNDHQLTSKQCQTMCNVATYINTPEESKAIDMQPIPKVIISASGMLTGGRILHHIIAFGSDPRNTILLTGYQAGGTRGARLMNGEPALKIFGTMVPIKAKVEMMHNTSAHADYEEMLQWLNHFKEAPIHTFITHGEDEASIELKNKIEKSFQWKVSVPEYLDQVTL